MGEPSGACGGRVTLSSSASEGEPADSPFQSSADLLDASEARWLALLPANGVTANVLL